MKYAALPDRKSLPVIGPGAWSFGGGMPPDRTRDRETVFGTNKIVHGLEQGR